jgi:putative FmdB family regulatory protein
MPIYEYTCRDCGHEFEILVRNGEKPSCPSCGREQLTKNLSVPAAHVAGPAQPACPAKEAGACGMSNCCGQGCGISQWQQ